MKDYVRLARTRSREVFIPLSHPPGHAQVDFGECVAFIGGVRMKLHVFCFDLPHSDACFIKAYAAEKPLEPKPPEAAQVVALFIEHGSLCPKVPCLSGDAVSAMRTIARPPGPTA